jgi:DNA primase
MHESAKYLIHADVTADGVVEREDVVGAVYGQTEGLLGNELDLRYLQEASKVGRIDVDVDSEDGRSFGELTIASSMDRVETAVLAASLETIGRVGPCRSEFRVTAIEDVRAAKRREVVQRAKELLAESFDQPAASSREILEEVRRAVRVEDITEYEGLPAGPNVADSDAIVVVEGRADVLQLIEHGIKNAVAVEGTDVPDAVATLSRDRTVTAFLDGDRGGDLILKELAQVGDVDYVALAPPERSVEDLSRREVRNALREKIPYDQLQDDDADGLTVPADNGAFRETTREQPATPTEPDRGAGRGVDAQVGSGAKPPDDQAGEVEGPASDGGARAADVDAARGEPGPTTADAGGAAVDQAESADVAGGAETGTAETEDPEASGGSETEAGTAATGESARDPQTLREHVAAVVEEGSSTVRLLDEAFGVIEEAPDDDAFDAIEGADSVPAAVVLDGTLTQRILDVAAQRGVGQVVARETGDLVKQPVGVRIRTAEQLQQ